MHPAEHAALLCLLSPLPRCTAVTLGPLCGRRSTPSQTCLFTRPFSRTDCHQLKIPGPRLTHWPYWLVKAFRMNENKQMILESGHTLSHSVFFPHVIICQETIMWWHRAGGWVLGHLKTDMTPDQRASCWGWSRRDSPVRISGDSSVTN